jgi:hypothetical protein
MEQDVQEFLDGLRPNRALEEIRQHRIFGLAILACAAFVLTLSFVFPDTDRNWWVGCGLLVLAVGAFKVDQARRMLNAVGT